MSDSTKTMFYGGSHERLNTPWTEEASLRAELDLGFKVHSLSAYFVAKLAMVLSESQFDRHQRGQTWHPTDGPAFPQHPFSVISSELLATLNKKESKDT
jgi:hypothetical protein